VGIAQCHVDRFVPHEGLDSSEIDTGHHQPGSKSVSETVEMEILDFCPINSIFQNSAHEFIRFSETVQENLAELAPLGFSD
jgi:hypothetical protein